MKKRWKRVVSVLCSFALLVGIFGVYDFKAHAVSNPETLDGASYKIANIWADPENALTQEMADAFTQGDNTAIAGAVGFHKIQSSGNYYLFLPSNADCNNLKFWFTTDEQVTLNGIELTSGEPTDALGAINEGGISYNYTLMIGSNSYTVTAMKSGKVGAVYIDTQSGSISSINSNKENVESGTILVVRPGGKVDYSGVLASMHGRGNASWGYSTKKPYSIKLDSSAALLGMSKSKKWALLANHSSLDASLLRNQITYDFSDYIGVKYQVHCKPVDLYVNQQYFGSYQLVERVQINSKRINVTDAYDGLEAANPDVDVDNAPANSVSQSNSSNIGQREYSESLNEPADVTGGYIFELEISRRWVEDAAGFCAYNKQGWTIKSCDRVSKGMSDYCYDLLFALGSSVYNGGVVPSTATSRKYGTYLATTVNNPAPAEQYHGKKWDEMLDAKSAVVYYWTQEYFMNLDSSTTSCYFYKDSDSVNPMLYAGPVWDMDNAWCYDKSGSRWGHSYTNAEDWYAKNCAIYRWNQGDMLTNYKADDRVPRTLYGALCYNCPGFWDMAENYWYSTIEPATQILLGNAVDETGKLRSVAEYAEDIELSGKMNSVRHGISAYNPSDVTSKMTAWLVKRNNWLNGKISKTSIENAVITPVPDQSFDAKEKTPKLTLTYGEAVLEEGVDYDLSYSNNVGVGTANVTVTGKGRFEGTLSTSFNIVKADVPYVILDETAYSGDTLYTGIPEELTPYLTCQWLSDGEAIEGEADFSYTVQPADKGKTITVAVTGDGINFNGATVVSSECAVEEGVKPGSYIATIAAWNYDFTANSAPLDNQNETGTYIYTATEGDQAGRATLRGSTDSVNTAKIEWSEVGDEFKQTKGTLAKDRVPVLSPSAESEIAWGAYPFFETTVSTVGYREITYTARVGATKKGPVSWKVQYSTDGVTFNDVDATQYTLTANKTMQEAFCEINLPSECDNKESVYIRMTAASDATVAGGNYLTDEAKYSGSAGVNNIEIKGVSSAEPFDLTVSTVMMADPDGSASETNVECPVSVNGTLLEGNTVRVTPGETVTIVVNEGRSFERTVTFVASPAQRTVVIPVITIDMNADGIINAKDYALILKTSDERLRSQYISVFERFINEAG